MIFKTEDTTLSFSTFNIELTVIENFDDLFDDLLKKGDNHPDVLDERIPYWADLWASAIGLSRYLVDNHAIIHNKKILEIGCGLGLPSIVAGKLGASEVTLTDYLQDALNFARLNWDKNISKTADIKVAFQLLDWRAAPPQYEADILLAADVAYEKRAFDPLLAAFKNMVKPTTGRIIIAEPNRYISREFFENMALQGYSIRKTTYQIERRGHFFTVNVFDLKADNLT